MLGMRVDLRGRFVDSVDVEALPVSAFGHGFLDRRFPEPVELLETSEMQVLLVRMRRDGFMYVQKKDPPYFQAVYANGTIVKIVPQLLRVD